MRPRSGHAEGGGAGRCRTTGACDNVTFAFESFAPVGKGGHGIERPERIRALINQLRLLNRIFRDRIRIEGADVTLAQMSVLRAVEDHGPMRPVDLAHRTGLSASTITGLVDRLEADGFVNRLRRQEDRREVEVRLSERGDALLRDLHGSVFSSLVELFSPLSDTELGDLEAIFAKLARR